MKVLELGGGLFRSKSVDEFMGQDFDTIITVCDNASDAQSGKQTLTGRAAGSVIEIGGGIVGLGMQYGSIQNRAAGQQSALNEAFNTRTANQERGSRYLVQNQEIYRGAINDN